MKHSARYQGKLVTARQSLDCHLAPARAAAGVAILLIHNPQRPAAPEIFGTHPRSVLNKASRHISGNTGIERIIRAEDYIYLPVQARVVTFLPLQQGSTFP